MRLHTWLFRCVLDGMRRGSARASTRRTLTTTTSAGRWDATMAAQGRTSPPALDGATGMGGASRDRTQTTYLWARHAIPETSVDLYWEPLHVVQAERRRINAGPSYLVTAH